MREILFRGKTEQGEWVYGVYYKQDHYYNEKVEKHCIITSTDTLGNDMDLDFCDVIPETIGQFTGLTDKNGKKIFEGDIVKVVYTEKRDFRCVKYDDEFEMIETVIYDEKHACFMLKINNEGITMFRPLCDFESNVRIKSIEIISNIYDNKELLGE